ncbi:o-succinylbenzoate--CoA ligase [Sediminibacillus albus]|uniref:2-succinylbenzoate--CoA ligase n=1 Tax=Sediminibacillus albus TaxID=407036 RepID=A0A1G8Z387_9BACI|nr:o-succinylbenzoate--CoA ligase [Sediminibacillus albus]SDK08710.1 O-succinylbenzoic acid--CoA ligase [Sediminibacillus albus]
MTEVIPHWLDKQADLSPDGNAIETPAGINVTFWQLRDQSRSYAKKLAAAGVKQGDHVAILSGNCIEMAIAIHAISYIGAVAVLLNIRLSPSEIAFQLNDAHVSLLLTHPEAAELAEQAGTYKDSSLVIRRFADIDRYAAANISLKQELRLDDLFTIIYTSGTTGFPKGVEHTYGNHWWSAVSSVLNLGLASQDKWLASLPLFHVGGLSLLVKSVVYGMPVYLLKKFDVELIHQGIIAGKVTIVSVVSVMLERLLERLEGGSYPASFRCMLLGGGPASQTLLEKAKQYQVPVFQTYGMTETSSQIVTLSPKEALAKLGSAGKPLFPAQLKIMSAEESSPIGEVGEIFVKGPMVTRGYYKNEQANQKTFQDGWLATGDLGYLDQDGFLYVMDRRKDLIISGGENVYPAEIESVLTGIEGVKEAGVIGKSDRQWGEVPVAFAVRADKNLTKEEVLEHCRKHLAKYKVPKQIYFISEMPRNASNKLVRHQLAAFLKDEEK